MKKFFLASALFFSTISMTAHAESLVTNHQNPKPVPPYAKWGILAMNEVKNRYKVEIVDYLHVGRKTISPNVTQETFKFWVRGANHFEYGVFVIIKFDTRTEKVLSIHFMKTNH